MRTHVLADPGPPGDPADDLPGAVPSSRRPSPVRKTGPSQRSSAARSIARAVRGASGMVTTLPLLRVMVNVAWAVAVADPRRAEQIARDIGGGFGTTEALAEIAKVIAVTDPCRAEHIASSIDDSYEKAQALADIARVVGATDRNRAAALACQADRAAADIDNEDRKVRVLGSRAAMPAGASPGRHGRKRRRVARADLVPGRAGHRSPDPASHRPGSVRAAEVPGRLHHPVAATHKPAGRGLSRRDRPCRAPDPQFKHYPRHERYRWWPWSRGPAASWRVTQPAFPAFPGNLPVQSAGLTELADALD